MTLDWEYIKDVIIPRVVGAVGIAAVLAVIVVAVLSPAPEHSPAAVPEKPTPTPTVEVTCEEGVLDKLESAMKAYDTSTYKAKREAGEKLAAAAMAVRKGCEETEVVDPDPGD
jgi:hypothetical protein